MTDRSDVAGDGGAHLAHLTSPEVAAWARAGATLVVPVGSTEQHGAHLPLATDADISEALCEQLRSARDDVIVAPLLPYGSSGEHAGFAGTLSIGSEALERVVIELGRSAAETFSRIAFVNAHGGNTETLIRAVRLLRAESRDVRLFQPRYDGGDAHAGRTETSLQLALHPERVRGERAEVGDTRPLAELLPLLRAGGLRAVTASGVLGDPTGANADEGRALLDRVGRTMLAEFAAWLASPATAPAGASVSASASPSASPSVSPSVSASVSA